LPPRPQRLPPLRAFHLRPHAANLLVQSHLSQKWRADGILFALIFWYFCIKTKARTNLYLFATIISPFGIHFSFSIFRFQLIEREILIKNSSIQEV
jgi:hypothetical protein